MTATEDRNITPVIESVFIHLAFALVLTLIILNQPSQSDRGTEQIQFDTVKKQASHGGKLRKGAAANVKQKDIPSHISLADLGMRLDHSISQSAGSESSEPAAEALEDDHWDLNNPDPRIARFNQYIYNTVQGWLDRDAYLNHAMLQGTVKVRIWFDGEGNYLENETEYEAIDPDFQRIVARALKKSFANPVPRPFLFMNRKFSIQRVVVIRNS